MEDGTVTASLVTEATAAYYGLEAGDLLGTTRTRQVVRARWVAMYLCRELAGCSRQHPSLRN